IGVIIRKMAGSPLAIGVRTECRYRCGTVVDFEIARGAVTFIGKGKQGVGQVFRRRQGQFESGIRQGFGHPLRAIEPKNIVIGRRCIHDGHALKLRHYGMGIGAREIAASLSSKDSVGTCWSLWSLWSGRPGRPGDPLLSLLTFLAFLPLVALWPCRSHGSLWSLWSHRPCGSLRTGRPWFAFFSLLTFLAFLPLVALWPCRSHGSLWSLWSHRPCGSLRTGRPWFAFFSLLTLFALFPLFAFRARRAVRITF